MDMLRNLVPGDGAGMILERKFSMLCLNPGNIIICSFCGLLCLVFASQSSGSSVIDTFKHSVLCRHFCTWKIITVRLRVGQM